MRTLQVRHFVLGCSQQGSVCLQEVWLALNDKHVNLTKRPALSSADIKDVPQALIKLMQQCWHKVCLPHSEPTDEHSCICLVMHKVDLGLSISVHWLFACSLVCSTTAMTQVEMRATQTSCRLCILCHLHLLLPHSKLFACLPLVLQETALAGS